MNILVRFIFLIAVYHYDGSCETFPLHSLDFYGSFVENIFSSKHQKRMWKCTNYTAVNIWAFTLLS